MIHDKDICFNDYTITHNVCGEVLEFCSSRDGVSAIFKCKTCNVGVFLQRIKKEELIM